MACQEYVHKNFSERDEKIIQIANAIIANYQAQGFQLTLRQLYYQFVSKDVLPNNLKMYDLLGNIINNARLAGLVDWEAIVDRTRELRGKQFWNSPTEILKTAARSFSIDRWKNQEWRPEVFIEKDALLEVFEKICLKWDVSYFSCRGYTSQSEMWAAGQRILNRFRDTGQKTTILHFGDHDPSGIDMSRDIQDRLTMFCAEEEGCFEINRIALNMPQVKVYNCPPNPAKLSDSRSGAYVRTYGEMSWELDALDPSVLAGLVQEHVKDFIDDEIDWDEREKEQEEGRQKILKAVDEIEMSGPELKTISKSKPKRPKKKDVE